MKASLLEDPVARVRAASARIVHTVEKLSREGHEWAVLEIALVDTMVRFEKARSPQLTTSAALYKLSTVILAMAREEEAQASKERH